jgi:hypothetical protein
MIKSYMWVSYCVLVSTKAPDFIEQVSYLIIG